MAPRFFVTVLLGDEGACGDTLDIFHVRLGEIHDAALYDLHVYLMRFGHCHADLREARLFEFFSVLFRRKSTRHSPRPGGGALFELLRHLFQQHDVRDAETTAACKDAEGFAEDPIFVGGEVYHAV